VGYEELFPNTHPFINFHLTGSESESGYHVLRIDTGKRHFDVLTEVHRDAATRAQAMTLYAKRLDAYHRSKVIWKKRCPSGVYQRPQPPKPKFRVISGMIKSLDAAYAQISLPRKRSGQP
jgi:hypothetical protein